MPRIPQITASPDIASTTGARRSVLGVPTPRFEEIDPRAAQQVGRAAAQVGREIREVGQIISAAQERQRLARDTVKVLDASTGYIQAMDAFTAEAQKDPDYETLPDRLRQHAQELEAQYGQGLSPQALAAFKQRITPHTEGLHRSTLAYVAKTDVARAKTVADELEAVHTRGMLEADSEVRKEYHRMAYASGLESLVAENFLLPEERDARLRTLGETVTKQEAVLAVYARPEIALHAIETRLDTQQPSGVPEIDAVPVALLPALRDQAALIETETLGRINRSEQLVDAQHARRLDAEIAVIENVATDPRATAEDMAGYLQELRRVQRERDPQGRYRERFAVVGNLLLNRQQELVKRDEARTDAERRHQKELETTDDPQILAEVAPRVYGPTLQTTADEIWRLYRPNGTGLSYTRAQAMANEVQQREHASHFTRQPWWETFSRSLPEQIEGPANEFALLTSSGDTTLQALAKRRKENANLARIELYTRVAQLAGPKGLDPDRTAQTEIPRLWEDIVQRYQANEDVPPRPAAYADTRQKIAQRHLQGMTDRATAEREAAILLVWRTWEQQRPQVAAKYRVSAEPDRPRPPAQGRQP